MLGPFPLPTGLPLPRPGRPGQYWPPPRELTDAGSHGVTRRGQLIDAGTRESRDDCQQRQLPFGLEWPNLRSSLGCGKTRPSVTDGAAATSIPTAATSILRCFESDLDHRPSDTSSGVSAQCDNIARKHRDIPMILLRQRHHTNSHECGRRRQGTICCTRAHSARPPAPALSRIGVQKVSRNISCGVRKLCAAHRAT